MRVQGNWHAEGSAAKIKAALRVDDGKVIIESDSGLLFSGVISDLKASARLGNVERKLTLPDDSIFATGDNDGIDQLFKGSQSLLHFIHRLESRLGWVAIALVLTIAFSFGFIKWGIPWISVKVAHVLPHKTNELIAAQAFDFLDEYIFEESQLDEAKKNSIRVHFNDTLLPLARFQSKNESDIKFTLHFRQWQQDDQGIPNALALPSGDIILTDKFVELSQNQNEIDSVLLHEIGHVVHRHSLQRVIQGTLITTIVMLATGDTSSIADIGLGLGSLLVSSEYARDHESEADLYAFETMLQANIDPIAFSNIMTAMTSYFETNDDPESANTKASATKPDNNKDESLLDYISSHPVTKLRVEQANRYSECFRQNLKICEPH